MNDEKMKLFEKYEALKNEIVGDFLCLDKYRFINPALVADIIHGTITYIQYKETNAVPLGIEQALMPFVTQNCPQCGGKMYNGHCSCEQRGQ